MHKLLYLLEHVPHQQITTSLFSLSAWTAWPFRWLPTCFQMTVFLLLESSRTEISRRRIYFISSSYSSFLIMLKLCIVLVSQLHHFSYTYPCGSWGCTCEENKPCLKAHPNPLKLTRICIHWCRDQTRKVVRKRRKGKEHLGMEKPNHSFPCSENQAALRKF